MRREIYLLAVGVLFFGLSGCTYDSGIDKSEDILACLHKSSLDFGVETTFLEDSTAFDNERNILQRANESYVFGNYLTEGGHRIRVTALNNSGNVNGTGRISGPIYIEVRFRTACVQIVENRATIAGEITYAELGDNPFEFPIERGWYIYLAVEDNGRPTQGRRDRYHDEVYFGPPVSGPLCAFLPPNNPFIWPESEWREVEARQDQIIVRQP